MRKDDGTLVCDACGLPITDDDYHDGSPDESSEEHYHAECCPICCPEEQRHD